MRLLENIGCLVACRADGGQGDIHPVADAALAWAGESIEWVGPRDALPPIYAGAERFDAGGRLVIPGLVDCHTHLVFGGWRADEFEQRILGRSYLEIAAAGGGIARTMRLTRAASDAELAERASGVLAEASASVAAGNPVQARRLLNQAVDPTSDSPDTEPMGVPFSHGCIRMRNDDIIQLFDLVDAGTEVEIVP